MKTIRTRIMAATALAGLAWPAATMAQQAETPAVTAAEASNENPQPAPAVAEGDITVTAQRRESTVQNTAASISVVTSDALIRVGVNDSQSLQILVPGLVVAREVASSNQIYIRGVGNNILGIGSSNSVATYVDGVYMPNQQQSFQVFNDIERIEVLKGPQAVLYGRNATGGALLTTSKAPQFDFSAKGDVSYGNYDAVLARVTATGPISDNIAIRASAQFGRRDGFGINITSGRGQDFDRTFAARTAILAKFSEDFKLTLAGDYSFNNSGEFSKSTNTNAWNYKLSSLAQYTPDPRKRYANVESTIPMRDRGVRGTINWDVGFGDITSVTSYRRFNTEPYFYDSDGVESALTGLSPNFRIEYRGSTIFSKQFYHESYLATDANKPFSAIIGANYFNERAGHDHRQQAGAGFSYQDRRLTGKAWSVYADFNWRFTDTLTAIAGGRYSSESKLYSITPRPADANGNITGTGTTVTGYGKWNQFTPRFGIEYRPEPGLLLYLNATNGFKSGGLNETNPLNQFEPESIWSYEVGMKSKPSSAITLNLSAFYYDYTKLQVQQITLPTFARRIENAADAKIWGVEGDISIRLSPQFRISANAQALGSKYGDLKICADIYGPCTIIVGGVSTLNPASNINVKGNPLVRAPKFSALIAADYTIPVGDGTLSLHGETSYRSRVFWTPYKIALHASDPFWIVNANIRYDFPGDKYYVALWGQNLTDTLTESHIADVSRFLGPGDGAPKFVHWAPPRTYGVRLGFNF